MRRLPRRPALAAAAMALCVAVAGCNSNPDGPAAPPMPAGGYPKGAPAAPGVMPPKSGPKSKTVQAPGAD